MQHISEFLTLPYSYIAIRLQTNVVTKIILNRPHNLTDKQQQRHHNFIVTEFQTASDPASALFTPPAY